MEKDLQEYLRRHPDCELYTDQDRLHWPWIPIWNKLEQLKISGNAGTLNLFADQLLTCGLAAPLEENLAAYLRGHRHCEVYAGQDKPPGAADC